MRPGPEGAGGRRRSRLAALLLLSLGWLFVAVLAGAAPASAHAQLASSDPRSGAALDQAPRELTLQFSESITQVPDSMKLIAADGSSAPIASTTVDGHTLHVALAGSLPDAGYVFVYRVISADSHPVAGAITFTVGEAATAASVSMLSEAVGGPGSDLVSALAGLNRWLGFAGVILLVGVPMFVVVCCRDLTAFRTDAVVRGLTGGGGLMVVLTALASLPLQGARSVGGGLGAGFGEIDTVLDTGYGSAALARIAFVAALLAGLAAAARFRAAAEGAAVAAVAVLFTFSRSGHPAVADNPVLTMAVDAAHFGAVAVWIGGLLMLAIRVLPGAVAGTAATEFRAVLGRWSPVAMAAVAVLAVTGSIQAWRELQSVEVFFDTTYGRWILVKMAGLALMLVLAEYGRRKVRASAAAASRSESATGARVFSASLGAALADSARQFAAQPAPERAHARALRRSVMLELLLAAGVLAATSMLVVQTPGAHATDQHSGNMAGTDMADMPGMNMPGMSMPGMTTPADTAGRASRSGSGAGTGLPASLVSASLELPHDVRVEVVADPARAGSAVITLTLRSASGALIDAPEVTVTAEQRDAGISSISLTPVRAEAGRFTVDAAQLLVAGSWTLTVTVRTTDVDAGVGTVEIPLAPA